MGWRQSNCGPILSRACPRWEDAHAGLRTCRVLPRRLLSPSFPRGPAGFHQLLPPCKLSARPGSAGSQEILAEGRGGGPGALGALHLRPASSAEPPSPPPLTRLGPRERPEGSVLLRPADPHKLRGVGGGIRPADFGAAKKRDAGATAEPQGLPPSSPAAARAERGGRGAG